MTPTAARPSIDSYAHWYTTMGATQHEVQKADKSGMTPTTLRHARKLNLLPSVTNILRLLHKEALVNWQIEQACLAILTAPRKEGEGDDAFVLRVLHVEQQQHQERNLAADRGTQIHQGMELLFKGQPVTAELDPWIRPAFEALCKMGETVATEKILVGPGYAGTTDLLQNGGEYWRLWDFKGTKKIPDPIKQGAWPEHRLQLSAYAEALRITLNDGKPIIPGNVYISTANQGEYVICEHEDWEKTYWNGFRPLVEHWQWANQYEPEQPQFKKREQPAAEVPAPQPAPAAVIESTGPPPPMPAEGQVHKSGKRVVWTPGIRVQAPTTGGTA